MQYEYDRVFVYSLRVHHNEGFTITPLIHAQRQELFYIVHTHHYEHDSNHKESEK